jgi:hypothetical protein
MYGILIANNLPFQRVAFDAPEDVFSKQAVTIIGACIEKNFVYMGIGSANVPNTSFPDALRNMSVFEHTNGPILVIKTDVQGDPVDIQLSDLE